MTLQTTGLKGQTLSVRLAGVDAPEVRRGRISELHDDALMAIVHRQMAHFGKEAQPFSAEAFDLLSASPPWAPAARPDGRQSGTD